MDVAQFRKVPILGILRGVEARSIEPLADAVASTGVRAIEITMNTAGAPDLIRRTIAAAGGRLMVGAGTVLTRSDLRDARDAGASFVVLPTVVPEVVAECVRQSVPVFPGALTPTEVHAAWSAGATMVKVFPAACFGPEYFRQLKGPFRDVELLACGGVTAENLPAYFSCGASAVAFGANIFRPDWLAAGDYARIGAAIARLVAAHAAWSRSS